MDQNHDSIRPDKEKKIIIHYNNFLKRFEKNEFIKKEIIEMSKIYDLNSEILIKNVLNGKLDINYIKTIKDKKNRGITYECLWTFSDEIFNSELIKNVLESLNEAKNTKEKGFLVEKKVFFDLKIIFSEYNGNDLDFLDHKIAFIISRRIVFLQNLNFEFENVESIELSALLQQIITDINSYFFTLAIKSLKNKILNENYLKSLILRILVILCSRDSNVSLDLKRIENKSIYFFKSKYIAKNSFIHFYSKVFLCPPISIYWDKIGLNGGYHYLNKRRIIEPNLYNNEVNSSKDLLNFVKKQNNLKFYLDRKMIENQKEYVYEKIKKDRQINKEWGDYFSEIPDLSYEEMNQLLNFKSHKIKIKKLYHKKEIDNFEELKKIEKKINELNLKKRNKNSEKKMRILLNKKKFIEDLISEGRIKKNYEEDKKWIQRDFSYVFILKIYLSFIEFFKDYEGSLYYSIYFDFRGRFYFNSITSPDKGWPFRFIYNFGILKKNKENTEKESNFLINHGKYQEVLERVRVDNLDKFKVNTILWTLLSIGSLTIRKKKSIREEEFILEGLNNYLEKKKLEDYLENSELFYYYSIIEDINEEVRYDRYLLKDISGSIFQNASVILGLKEFSILNDLNLNGEVWTDPYWALIEEIRKNVDNGVLEFFNRKTLKKPIMTRYYNSTLYTSFKYFITEVRKMDSYNDANFNKIWLNFKKIFDMMKNLEKDLMFKNSSEEYKIFLEKSKIKEIKFEDFSFSIISYELKPKRIDIIVKGKRITTTTYVQTKIEYKIKNKNSKIPNIFHGEDSWRARSLILDLRTGCFSIHDAFGVSACEVDELIIKANKLFNINTKRSFYISDNKIKEKIFSKFIIL